MRHWTLMMCTVWLLGVAGQVLAAPINPQLIQPGVGIGHIRLTAYSDKNFFGEIGLKPTEGDAAMGGRVGYTWTTKNPVPGHAPNTLLIYTRQDGAGVIHRTHLIHVKSIRVTSSYFHMVSGIGSGATLTAIRRRFPHIKKNTTLVPDKIEYADVPRGISFEFAKNPRTSQARCTAIWVFGPGQTMVYD